MLDQIAALQGHYIVCGVGRVGTNVAHELEVTQRPYVVLEDAQAALEAFRERYPKALCLHGDSSDDDMLRPTVVSFLDEMLRTDTRLRVEEVALPAVGPERSLGHVAPLSRDYVVLAVRSGERWEFNPSAEHRLRPGDYIIAMMTPEGRREIERRLGE